MIVRVWECQVKAGQTDRVLEILQNSVLPRVVAVDGFLGVEFFRSLHGEERVLVVSRWRDEQALADFAGPLWGIAPWVDFLAADHLAHPSKVHHYLPVEFRQPTAPDASGATSTAGAARD